MKKILLFSFILLGVQSCVIKEEITIRDVNRVDYQYALDCSNGKMYLPNNFSRTATDFISDEEIEKLSKGMTVQQFLDFLKSKDVNTIESDTLENYLKNNNIVFQKVKNDSLAFDFLDLTFKTISKSNTLNLDEQGNELNNFISGLIKNTREKMYLHYVSNKKVIKDKTLTVNLNTNSFNKFYTVFSDFYSSANTKTPTFKLEDFISYQIKVNTPKPIIYTNLEGNIFSFDRKSVTGNFKLKQILENEISQIKVVYE